MTSVTHGSCCGDLGVRVRALEHRMFCLTLSRYEGGLRIPPHASPCATLCLALDGGYWEHYGRTRLRCEPATLVFHPAGDVHENVISDAGSRCLNVTVHASLLETLSDGARSRLESGNALRGVPRRFAFDLYGALRRGADDAVLEAEELLLTLLADLGRQPALRISRTPPGWLERVRERVHDDFAHRLELEGLAATAGVHRVSLARAWRAHFGCTIGQYVRQRRVEFACRQLIAGRAGVSRIALAAGFSDQSHLTHTFRALVGLTPGAFRARYAAPSGTGYGATRPPST